MSNPNLSDIRNSYEILYDILDIIDKINELNDKFDKTLVDKEPILEEIYPNLSSMLDQVKSLVEYWSNFKSRFYKQQADLKEMQRKAKLLFNQE